LLEENAIKSSNISHLIVNQIITIKFTATPMIENVKKNLALFLSFKPKIIKISCPQK